MFPKETMEDTEKGGCKYPRHWIHMALSKKKEIKQTPVDGCKIW